jgi:hypothetical protein
MEKGRGEWSGKSTAPGVLRRCAPWAGHSTHAEEAAEADQQQQQHSKSTAARHPKGLVPWSAKEPAAPAASDEQIDSPRGVAGSGPCISTAGRRLGPPLPPSKPKQIKAGGRTQQSTETQAG